MAIGTPVWNLNPARRATATVLLVLLALTAPACRARPDVRVLADERLAIALDQIVALYEARAGQRVRLALASRGRIDVLLVSGNDDVVVCEAAQLDARPMSIGVSADGRRPLGRLREGERVDVAVRVRALGSPSARAFLRFLLDEEARAILASAGLDVTAR